MNISIDWIKDFVSLPQELSDKEISERITLGVCEVEGWERTGAMLSKVTVAEVTATQPHPDADKLKLATVNLGDGEATVVCGAPNCTAGIKVPYAALGTSFPGGFTLEPKKIRGVLSEGMLCAEDELGLSEDHEGLMILPSNAPVGKTLADALPEMVNDLVLDIDNKSLTHRPDLWGHYGMAREFAAVFHVPYQDKMNAEWMESMKAIIAQGASEEAPVTLEVDADSANRGFLALAVDGIEVGESPAWMQRRLNAAGMRPINSIVDVSNYAMLETGIPNHIFDRSTVRGGKIVVRRAGEEQSFTTLDGQERTMMASDTMVCDAQGPSAIAGIMGGLESSVTENTTGVLLEVANWEDASIRRTSTRLGLRTDASQRYEKCLDSQRLESALYRILELLRELNPQCRVVGSLQSANMPEPVELSIPTGPARISSILGRNVDEKEFTRILEALGFGVTSSDSSEGFTHHVSVPTWRSTKDVECEADIVEEIGRIIGFDNIDPVSPAHDIAALRLSSGKTMERQAQDFLVLRGRALEVMTYPLVGAALLKKASWPVLNENLVLANALSPDSDRMRPSLIPSLLSATAENRKTHERFRLFESGRSYAQLEGEAFSQDLYQLGVVFQDTKANPFVELADVAEELLSHLGLPARIVPMTPDADHPLVPASWPGRHPHEALDLQIMGRSRGVVFSLHPQVARSFKIKGRTAMAIVDLTELRSLPLKDKTSFRSLDRFPGSIFDLTVVTAAHEHAAKVVAAASKAKTKVLRNVEVLDVFTMESGEKALTLRVEFRDSAKTLDAEVIKAAEDAVIQALEKAGYPLRGQA